MTDKILEALEIACREKYKEISQAAKNWIKTDDNAVRYGVLTINVASLTGLSVSRTRRLLRIAERDGTVLSNKSYAGAVIQWWPIGLLSQVKS